MGGACDVTPSGRLKNPGTTWVSPGVSSQEPEVAMSMGKKRVKERRQYLVPFRPPGIGQNPTL